MAVFYSPDGRQAAFISGEKLPRVFPIL